MIRCEGRRPTFFGEICGKPIELVGGRWRHINKNEQSFDHEAKHGAKEGMMKGRAYVTAKTAQTFEGNDEADIKRKALELFRKDIASGNLGELGSWVEVEVKMQSSTESATSQDPRTKVNKNE